MQKLIDMGTAKCNRLFIQFEQDGEVELSSFCI